MSMRSHYFRGPFFRSRPTFSNFNYAYGSPQPTTAAASLIAVHSTAQWQARFNANKGSNKLMVLDFTAAWCSPCRLMEPFLQELASKYSTVEFIKIDVDELMNVAQQFGVTAMPTIILMKKGLVVGKVVGVRKEELPQKIEQQL